MSDEWGPDSGLSTGYVGPTTLLVAMIWPLPERAWTTYQVFGLWGIWKLVALSTVTLAQPWPEAAEQRSSS